MLDLSKDIQFFQNGSKSTKVQANLHKIKSLINGALKELKESERISTNESDSSESQSPTFIHRMSIDLHKGETEMFLENLEKGYVMVKHSPNSKPKEKYVYVSSDRRHLCWKSLEKDDEKRMELRKINIVLRGEEETMCYVQSKSVKILERFIILRSDSRDLELEAFNVEESIKFCREVKEAIKNARGIHLSYKI